MSEYQYYEFLALDRPLTDKDIAQVRHYSSRADISATRFVNEYNWGDFRGDPHQFVTRWFDLMLYLANWGTRRLLIGLPAEDLNASAWRAYQSESVKIEGRKGRVLVDLWSDTEEPDDDFDGGEGWMASLTPIRGELLAGDLRPLYLGWLAGMYDDQDDKRRSPPVPPGLGDLTAPQRALARFLRVDGDLLDAAAQSSGAIAPPAVDLARWIAGLPVSEKDQLLLDAARGATSTGAKLLARYHASASDVGSTKRPCPLMKELFERAEQIRHARETAERERASRAREKRRAKEAAAREAYLRELQGRPEQAWQRVEEILRLKQNKEYQNAVTTLRDLRCVAERQLALDIFRRRVRALREAHKAKYTFVKRLDESQVDA